MKNNVSTTRGLAIVFGVIILLSWLSYATNPKPTPETVNGEQTIQQVEPPVYVTAEDLLSYTNIERAKAGVQPLVINQKLTQSATNKARHHTEVEYWAHNTPDGVEPWAFIEFVDYRYYRAGENLACGYATGESIVQGWMNSPLHREVMLDPAFNEVGFGIAHDFSSCASNSSVNIVVGHYGVK